jgi:LysM repeat protein
MRQVITHAHGFPVTTAATQRFPFGANPGLAFGSLEQIARTCWPTAGVISNVRITMGTAPGSGNTRTYVVRKASAVTSGSPTFSDTAVTFSIADTATSGEDTSNTITVAAGDFLYLLETRTGTPASTSQFTVSMDFETATGESAYISPQVQTQNLATLVVNPFYQSAQSSSLDLMMNPGAVDASALPIIFPTDGAVSAIYLHVDSSLGSGGNGWTIALYKAVAASPTSFVKQDGSGGTVDTRCSVDGGTHTASWTGTLAVATGDRVYAEITRNGTPNTAYMHVAARFTATIDGESIMGAFTNTQAGDAQFWYANDQSTSSSATEADRTIPYGGISAFGLSKLAIWVGTAPGVSQTRSLTIRKNSASSALVVTTGVNTAGIFQNTTDTVTVEDGDTLSVMHHGTASVTASYINWSMVQAYVAPTITGTSIFGEDGTVAGLSRVHLLNLDGVTRTLSDTDYEGSAVLGGNLTLIEQAAAPAAIANAARLYAIDVAGKTGLYVIFGTGSAQQLEIEP